MENPRLMWQVPQVQQLKLQLQLFNVDLDQCQFGSDFRKPTRSVTLAFWFGSRLRW